MECVDICPVEAHKMEQNHHLFERDICTACGLCEVACLGKALRFFGRMLSVADAVQLSLEDKDFFADEGGITVSGGEPLLQSEFCAQLFKELRKYNIHCAVDTCGSVNWKNFEKVIPYTDLFLFDVKHIDNSIHQKYTGSSSQRVLENLEKLSLCNIPIEIRIPFISGFNTDIETIEAIGHMLSDISNISTVKLLPYHNLAASKYKAIGKECDESDFSTPSFRQIQEATGILRSFKLKV
jgi:pyruvate formate lyase activating enzyme